MSDMKSQGYTISLATAADAPGLVAANAAAFADNPTTLLMFPKHLEHLTPRDEFIAWRVKRFREASVNDGSILIKATPVDRPGVVAGFALWHRPGHFSEKEHRGSSMVGADGQTKEGVPACVDAKVVQDFSIAIEQVRKEIWNDDHQYWYLSVLAVHPDFQGQGIASKLIQDGTNRADEEGIPTYLVASERGTPVYLKCGFEPRAEPRKFRGEETYVAMVKSAKSSSTHSS